MTTHTLESTHILSARPMLGSDQSARTSVVEEAERIVSRSLNGHRLVDIGGDLNLVHNISSVGRIGLHYIDYGAGLTIMPQQLNERFVLVQVPLSGAMWLRWTDRVIEATAGTAVVSEVGKGETIMSYSDHCARLLVKIPLQLMRERQQELGVATVGRELARHPVIDVDRGPGRSWVDLLRSTITDLDTGAGLMSQPPGALFFERVLVDGFLLSNSEFRPVQQISSRPVSQATCFIAKHLSDPISVIDIAQACYLSVRALQEGFKKELGLSPMEYLRNSRLDAIHDELQRTGGGRNTVGEVASRWGMTHLGRFAAAYRERFGQTPSETLRLSSFDNGAAA